MQQHEQWLQAQIVAEAVLCRCVWYGRWRNVPTLLPMPSMSIKPALGITLRLPRALADLKAGWARAVAMFC